MLRNDGIHNWNIIGVFVLFVIIIMWPPYFNTYCLFVLTSFLTSVMFIFDQVYWIFEPMAGVFRVVFRCVCYWMFWSGFLLDYQSTCHRLYFIWFRNNTRVVAFYTFWLLIGVRMWCVRLYRIVCTQVIYGFTSSSKYLLSIFISFLLNKCSPVVLISYILSSEKAFELKLLVLYLDSISAS